MSHVADGELHAYLDGALDLYPAGEAHRVRSHLESCADCRRRLEEEERVRKAAASVLAGTGPASVDVPPFESIRRRAEAERAGSRPVGRRARRAVRLGWAASVLVALGVGWMAGREPVGRSVAGTAPAPAGEAALRDAVSTPPSIDLPAAPEQSEAAEVAGADADRLAAESDLPAEAEVVARAADTPAAAPPTQATRTALAARIREVTEAAPVEEQARVAPDAVPAGEAGRIVGRVLRDGTDAPLGGAHVMVEGTSLGTVTDEEGRYVLAPVAAGSRTLRVQSIGYETVTDTVTVRAGGTEVVDLSSPVRTFALDELVVSGSGARPPDSLARADGRTESITIAPTTFEQLRRRGATESLEARREGMTGSDPLRPLFLPGLEVLEVGWTEVAPGVEGLFVAQRLAGDTARLELRFGDLDAGAEGAAPPAGLLEETLPEGVSQVEARLPDGAGWVVLRGRLPPDRLRRLLDLIR